MSNSFLTSWTIVLQAPLSMGFPRQEYGSGLPFPSSGDIPNRGMKPTTPVGEFFSTEPPGKAKTGSVKYNMEMTANHAA